MSSPSSPARRLRRLTCGTALVLFPALLVVEGATDPAGGGSGGVFWTAATRHAGALTVSALLLVASGILMAPAIAGLLHQARDRGAALTDAGAVMGALGGAGHIGLGVLYVFMLSLKGGDRSQMTAYADRLGANPVVTAVFFPFLLLFGLSLVALSWGAWRAGLIGIWGPVVTTVVVVAHAVLPDGIPAVEWAGLLALAAVFGYLGIRVLRMADTEWAGARPVTADSTPVAA